jgi:peroxiredoxin Q/BCP
MQAFQMDLEKLEVIGISTDSLETHKKFSEKYDISFPLISDRDGSIKNIYGKERITYLIDKHGIIRFIQKGVPKNEDFLKKIRAINTAAK